jgi:preprotein translocase subunit SecE
VARSTRQQRRQRRAQTAGTPPLRPTPPRPREVEAEEPPAESAEVRAEPRAETARGGFPGARFVQESIAELKKVEWPNQQAVISGTAVVLIACLIVGTYLWANDELWKYVVQHLLLR